MSCHVISFLVKENTLYVFQKITDNLYFCGFFFPILYLHCSLTRRTGCQGLWNAPLLALLINKKAWDFFYTLRVRLWFWTWTMRVRILILFLFYTVKEVRLRAMWHTSKYQKVPLFQPWELHCLSLCSFVYSAESIGVPRYGWWNSCTVWRIQTRNVCPSGGQS